MLLRQTKLPSTSFDGCGAALFLMQVLAAAALALAVPTSARAADNPSVCVLTIHEEITPNTLYLVRRGLREAEEKKATAVVIDMRTNGGSVDVMEEIIGLLERAPMKTYTYVDDKAYSAGAYIAAATDKIFMAPEASLAPRRRSSLAPRGCSSCQRRMRRRTSRPCADGSAARRSRRAIMRRYSRRWSMPTLG